MKNVKLLNQKLDEAIEFLQKQDAKLKPALEYYADLILNKVELEPEKALEYYCRLQEQYTNSIVLLCKIKEIVNYKE